MIMVFSFLATSFSEFSVSLLKFSTLRGTGQKGSQNFVGIFTRQIFAFQAVFFALIASASDMYA